MNQQSAVPSEYPCSGNLSAMGETERDSVTANDASRYLPHLSRMSEQLKQTSAQIENSVMEVCRSFQGIAQQAKVAVERGQTFLNQGSSSGRADGGFDSLIKRCGDTLVKVLNATQESGKVSRRAIERVALMDEASEKISAALEELDQISQGNRLMALNARIEAAHAGEQGTGFAVVAVEVAAQTEKSQKVTAYVGSVVEELRRLAASTREDLEKMLARDMLRIGECQEEVDESLAELRLAHGAMKNVLAGMSKDGAQLASEIGLAIRGMQFQDRVSQRIAHVVEDLDTLQKRLSRGPGQGDGAFGDEAFSAYTMVEERVVAGMGDNESAAGEVELF